MKTGREWLLVESYKLQHCSRLLHPRAHESKECLGEDQRLQMDCQQFVNVGRQPSIDRQVAVEPQAQWRLAPSSATHALARHGDRQRDSRTDGHRYRLKPPPLAATCGGGLIRMVNTNRGGHVTLTAEV